MKFSLLSGLKGRMLTSIGTTVFVGLGLVTGVVTFEATQTVRTSALAEARTHAERVARAKTTNTALPSLKRPKLARMPSRTEAFAEV
jgi:hypothetical protein